MEPNSFYPLTDRKGHNVREDESISISGETRSSSLPESQITLIAPEAQNTEENADDSKASRPHTTAGRVVSSVDSLRTAYQKKTWSMYLFLIAGTAFAVGHHFFYWHLDGKEAKHQSLMLRYGTILAFCAKASLSTAVILARRQRIWMVVRQNMVRLGTVDSIFTAAEDITALLDWNAVKKAKLATCLAIYIWATPFIVILTSETLSVVGGTRREAAFCPEARTLNFALEETFDWRLGAKIDNVYESALSSWNTTRNPNSFDYYNGPSRECILLVERVVNLHQAAVRQDAAREICTSTWNCSYVVDFVGPGYKCKELALGVNSTVKKLGNSLPPFGTRDIIPEGNSSYFAHTHGGEYAAEQVPRERGAGIPIQDPPYPKDFAVFRTEPVIWIGYATVQNYSKLQPGDTDVAGWDEAYTPTIFGCEHYEVNYTVEFNYTNGIQSYTIKHREYLGRVIDTDYIPGEDADDGTLDNTTAFPKRNYINPREVGKYRRIAAYHSLGQQFRAILNGTIHMPYLISSTEVDVLKTDLITFPNYLPIKSLPARIERMYEDIVISLLSFPSFAVVSWAYNATIRSGIGLGGDKTMYPCLRSKPTTFFEYNKIQLCIVYILSICLALVGVLLGVQAAHQEGVMRDVKPSSIIEASRALSLTQLQSNTGQYIRDLKVRFGWVQEHSGESVRGFGLAGDVSEEPKPPLV